MKLRRLAPIVFISIILSSLSSLGQDAKTDLQNRLSKEFVITKTTAQKDDIVTAGSVLTLHKDGLIMFNTNARVPSMITYKDGKLSMGFGDAMAITMVLGGNQTASTVPQRKFVSGERFWVTGVVVTDKSVVLQLFSDPFGDTRYYGQLKFPFQKHNIPPADELMKTISEVVTAEPPDTQAANNSAPQNSPSDAAQPEATKTIALGQTKDEVIAALGQPQKLVNLGAKEIYIYPDMKVIFVNGKVSDVQ